jgi:hypothetical protein
MKHLTFTTHLLPLLAADDAGGGGISQAAEADESALMIATRKRLGLAPGGAATEDTDAEVDTDTHGHSRTGTASAKGKPKKPAPKEAEEEGEGDGDGDADGEDGTDGTDETDAQGEGDGEGDADGEDGTDGTDETDAQGEGDGEGDGDEAEGEEEAPKLTKEQRAWVTAQIAAAAKEAEEAKGRVTALETELKAARTKPMAVAELHPILAEDDPAKIEALDKHMQKFEAWCLENWDGTEAVQADENGKGGQPGYSKEAIRAQYAKVQEQRKNLIPQARALQAQRKEQEAAARKVYPELFDAKRPEHGVLTSILAQAPGLKAIFPNVWIVIGDALAGEKARLERAKAKAKPGKPVAKPAKPGVKGAPAKPSGGGLSAKPQKKSSNVNAAAFMEMGGDRSALVKMLANAKLPTVSAGEANRRAK